MVYCFTGGRIDHSLHYGVDVNGTLNLFRGVLGFESYNNRARLRAGAKRLSFVV
jgi:hypothetical protein